MNGLPICFVVTVRPFRTSAARFSEQNEDDKDKDKKRQEEKDKCKNILHCIELGLQYF